MTDQKDRGPDEIPETDAEAQARKESEHTKKWIEQLKKKNAEDDTATRVPLNKNNAVGRIFANKPKPPNEQS